MATKRMGIKLATTGISSEAKSRKRMGIKLANTGISSEAKSHKRIQSPGEDGDRFIHDVRPECLY